MTISLSGIALEREGRAVFNGLDLTLSERRIGVIGRNGAGKSQLLRLIAGLGTPDRGLVRISDIDPARDRRAALSRIGILFQNPDHQIIFPVVDEELAFGLRSAGLAPAEVSGRVAAMLARFGRSDWSGRNVQSLSQGQRHLLCLMAVLLMEPETILLDEPFAGLDMATGLKLAAVLGGLPQRLVHVTHDLDAICDYDRVIWIDAGRLQADGPPGQILPAYVAAMREVARDDRHDL